MKKQALLLILCLVLGLPDASLADSVRETPVVKIFRQCAPSVVNISTERVVWLQQNPFWGNYGGQLDDFFNQFHQNTLNAMKMLNLGSGVIVSEDGLIVTNAHVINMASRIFVTLENGDGYEASLIGTDLQNDIALIQIKPRGALRPLPLSDDVLIGETVIAIGNPFGLQNSVTAGIVSGTHRNFVPAENKIFNDLVQTDVSINPGNSGGALINLEGKLIGINLAVVQNAQNIGFAITADKVKKMLEEYKKVKAGHKIVYVPVQ